MELENSIHFVYIKYYKKEGRKELVPLVVGRSSISTGYNGDVKFLYAIDTSKKINSKVFLNCINCYNSKDEKYEMLKCCGECNHEQDNIEQKDNLLYDKTENWVIGEQYNKIKLNGAKDKNKKAVTDQSVYTWYEEHIAVKVCKSEHEADNVEQNTYALLRFLGYQVYYS